MPRLLPILLLFLVLVGCAPPPRPTRVAVSRALPPIDPEKALVVFLLPQEAETTYMVDPVRVVIQTPRIGSRSRL